MADFHLRTTNVKALCAILSAIKPKQQACGSVVDDGGLTLQWEDDSKTTQCSVFLSAELFSVFRHPEDSDVRFGIQYSALVDTLNVFKSQQEAGGRPLDLRYPGPEAELMLESEEEGFSTYARVRTIEAPPSADLASYWEPPSSALMAPPALLREVIEDLEWPGGAVTIRLQRDPPRATFSSSGTGALEIELLVDELGSFHCAIPEVKYSYRHRALRAAFAHVGAGKDAANVSTKLSIDSRGLLKVTHVICGTGPGAGGGAGGAAQSGVMGVSQGWDSQRPGGGAAAGGGNAGIINFLLVPMDDSGEDEGGAEGGG